MITAARLKGTTVTTAPERALGGPPDNFMQVTLASYMIMEGLA